MSDDFDFDAVMDQVIHLERNIYDEARERGRVHGEELVKQEGLSFGIGYGRKAGMEIGGVLSLAIVLKSRCNTETSLDEKTREKILSTVAQIENMVRGIQWDSIASHDFEELVENLRNKRKLLEIRAKSLMGGKTTTSAVKRDDYSF